MWILSKFNYAKFDVFRLFVQMLSKKNLWEGGGGGSTPPSLVKLGLKFGQNGKRIPKMLGDRRTESFIEKFTHVGRE